MFARLLDALDRFCVILFFRLAPSLWRHRMAGWLLATLTLGLAILLSFGQLQAVFGFKTLLVIWGGYLGYWIARTVLRDYRPDYFLTTPWSPRTGAAGTPQAVGMDNAIAFAAAVLARAIIVAAVVLALALGA